MDKFFTSVGSALKTAKDKTLEGVAHLKAPPKEIACVNCPYAILVPPQLFDWQCAACGSNNTWDKEKCAACSTDKSTASPRSAPTVTCTMCQTVNEVPSNNAMKGLISAGRSTKKLAVKAADVTKEAYKNQTAAPRTFACQHCANQVDNPNWRDEGKQGDQDEQVMAVSQMTCPICKQTTSVPKMVIGNSLRKFGSSLSKGSHKLFYTAAGTPFIECEVCKNPCELPKKQNAPNQAVAVVSSVTLTCGKCGHSFATSY
jgi:hypothetical protein